MQSRPRPPSLRCWLAAGALASAAAQAHGQDLPGWPVRLGATAAGFSPPTAGDIDGDGDLEIVATVGDPLTLTGVVEGIWAFHHDGVEVVDGDQDATTLGVLAAVDFTPTFLRNPVTLGDLDADPALEILCQGPDRLLALNGNGQAVPGWPVLFPGAPVDSFNSLPILVADVDADGANEVIFTSGAVPGVPDAFALQVLDASGAPLSSGWPVTLERWTFGATVYAGVVGDLLDQPGRAGHLEIVVGPHPTANAAHHITAFDSGGDLLWEHPFPAVDLVGADMDGDGKLELVAAAVPYVEHGTILTRVVLLDGDGTLLESRRIEIGAHVHVHRSQGQDFLERQSLGYVGAHPVNELHPDVLFLAQLDADPTPEVVLSTRYLEQTVQSINGSDDLFVHVHRGELHALDLLDANALPHFPIAFDYDLPASPPVISPERLIDLDLDGVVEILTSELPSTFAKDLGYWRADGTQALTDTLLASTPGSFILEPVLRRGLLGDFDHDGRLDYASSIRRGELHLRRVPSVVTTAPPFPVKGWTDYRFDAQRTGVWKP